MSVVLVRCEEKRKGRHWRDVTTHVGGMIPGRNDAIGRQNLSTRSMAQKGTFGTSGTVSATAEPTVMVLLPIRGNAKCECECKARSVDSSPSTRVRGAQDALKAQVMVGNCTRNPTDRW